MITTLTFNEQQKKSLKKYYKHNKIVLEYLTSNNYRLFFELY